jgi:putative long chain acyl-CoA synthase
MSATTKVIATAVNGLEYARFGGLQVDVQSSPYEVVAQEPVYRLRHYYAAAAGEREPMLLVPPLMMTADVWDVAPHTSAVSLLHAHGIDPWVVDFGDPAHEPGGSRRDVTDHVLAVSDAIDRVRAATGRHAHIGGYSQGGLFCYQATAYRGSDGVASIVAMGSPLGVFDVDFLPEDLLWRLVRFEAGLLKHTGLPGWFLKRAFKWSNPTKALRSEIDYVLALHDREALLPRERQRRFLGGEGWIGWPGPALAEAMEQFSEARYLNGGLVYGDRAAGLADVTCPVLVVIGEVDEFGPAHQVRQIGQAAPNADIYETTLPVGHFGLANGSKAVKRGWPSVSAWVHWVAGEGTLPDDIRPLALDAEPAEPPRRGRRSSVAYGLGLAAGAGLSAPGALATTGRRAAATAREVSREAIAQVPRLIRLESIGPGTRISYAKLVADAARRKPDHVALLFDGRAHTYAAVDQRIDNVARGLISVGVRRGEHVGVLMAARPSALGAVAALNRLGAVAVLLRPGDTLAHEAELGEITRVVADPQHAADASGLGVEVLVLGGGGKRRLPAGVVDLEQIDPDAGELPKWYRPNAGRARDAAFILFTGTGERTRADRVTNGRWAQSALGAASAAKLTAADTVYSVNPLHHPSGLLLATAAPAAAGARLAMTAEFDAGSFWSEVRRYGATVVPYTWTMLRELVNAEPHPAERHHAIRLFVGSGMPANVWRRALERFAPAQVLELYASTRSGAILGNVSGRKVGALGRPLPGTPRVKLAAWDGDALVVGEDGYVLESDEGMLLVEATGDAPLRGVFSRDDAWIATGDVFRRDADGDLWLATPGRQVEDALGALDAVDLAVCQDGVAVVSARPNQTLTRAAVTRALRSLDPEVRPDTVRIVDAIPVTSCFRPSIEE